MKDNMISIEGISKVKHKQNNILYIGNEDTRRETIGFFSCGG